MLNGPSIGVCSWSLDRNDCLRSIQIAEHDLNVHVMQIDFFTRSAIDHADANKIKQSADAARIHIPGVFVGFDGEEYSSIKRIAETGGLYPDESYLDRLAAIEKAAQITASLGASTLSIHIGTISANVASSEFDKLVSRCAEAADRLVERNLHLLLETGREPIETLLYFIEAVGRSNVGVSFDPGNLIIYGTDDPVRAVRKLSRRIELVHLKDARVSSRPGVEYGQSAPLGTGDVQIPRVISRLRAVGYGGPLLIEGNHRAGGINSVRDGVQYIRSMLE